MIIWSAAFLLLIGDFMPGLWSRWVVYARSWWVDRSWAASIVVLVSVSGLSLSLAVPAEAAPIAVVPLTAPVTTLTPVVAKNDEGSARIAADAQNSAVEIVDERTVTVDSRSPFDLGLYLNYKRAGSSAT